MTLFGTGARLAGDALKAYHGVGSEIVGEKLASTFGSKIGETASRFLTPTVQLGGSALIAGAENVLSPILEKDRNKTADFARQPYQLGTLPLTNEQAGYLYLDQMKLQNQLALLQARQELSSSTSNSMPMGYSSNMPVTPQINPLGSLHQALNTTYTY
jgi:hypothetical protein